MAKNLEFDVLARDKASRTFDKIGRSADKTGRRFGYLGARARGVSAGIRTGFGAAAGAIAAIGGAQLLKGFIDEAREAGRVTRITENAIRATGGAANVTASHVGALAERLSNKAAIDDEVIQTGANLLLTFKKVRNEAGQGNNVFDRAVTAATDLSVQFGDVDTAAKMLGKALNDPLQGINAMSRAGVTFTKQQKDQIKSLVESGNVLKAQKIILKEVESQVGGGADAAPDPVQKLEVAWGNLQEKIGTAIMPLLTKFADWISSTVVPAIGSMVESFQTGEVKSSGFVGALQGLAVLLGEVWRAVGPVIQWAWKNLIRPVLSGIGWFLSKIPEGLQFLNLAWAEIWAAIGGVLADVGTVILRGLQALFDGITFIIEKLIEAGNFVGIFSDETESDFKKWRKGVSKSFDGAVNDLQGWKKELKNAPTKIKLEAKIDNYTKQIKSAERELKRVPKSKRTEVQARIDDLKKKRAAAQRELQKIKNKEAKIDADYQPARRKISAFLRREITRVERRFKAIVDADTRPGARRIRDFIKQQQNKGIVLSSSGEFIGFRGTGGPRLPSSRFKAAGGPIDGPGTSRSDSIPAMLSKGEYVVNAESTRKHYALIEAINRDKVPGFARGGIAGRAAIKIPVDVDTSGWKSFLNRMASSGFGPGPTPRTGNMRIVRDIFARMFGWAAHWGATYRLLMKESGFNNTAQNPTSTAYGMFQFLDSTWGGYGIRKTSDPRLQAIAGGRYIRARYGNPSRALAFHLAHNWYEQGTPWVPEDQIAMVHKGEAIVPRDVNEARLKQKPIDPKELGEAMAAALVRRLERSGKRLSLQPVGARADMFGRTEP